MQHPCSTPASVYEKAGCELGQSHRRFPTSKFRELLEIFEIDFFLYESESDVSLLHKPESLNESESDFSSLYARL